MAITQAQYKDMKEYWDYQRKVQYNKETVHRMAESFENRIVNEFGMMSLKDIQETLWNRIKSSEYEEPHKGWIPNDPSLRFDWEQEPNNNLVSSTKTKGRQVVVKARDKWKEDFEKLIDDDNLIQK